MTEEEEEEGTFNLRSVCISVCVCVRRSERGQCRQQGLFSQP